MRFESIVSVIAITLLAFPGDPGAAEPAPGDFWESEAGPEKIPEISRHPTEMPDSPDYGVYRDGELGEKAEAPRGPMTQEVHLRVREVVAEVVEGTTLELWTLDGRIPGPMLRSRVGDTLDFHLHNPPESRFPHNVDFHAVTGPGGGSVKLDTLPGSESHLRVKLLKPGIYVYHCAFPDIPSHIAHGMYGLIVVEPREGLRPVDHEYYLMQSELYTTEGGGTGYVNLHNKGHLDFNGELGNLEEPTFVVFNGRPEAIAGKRALGSYGEKIRTGETARFYVGNIGPNLISSFHVIGEIFDRVYVEGSFGLVNENVQTTLVPSGGAVGVEMRFEVPGDYIPVDHSIFRMHKGAAGTILVTGPPEEGVYEPKKHSEGLR